MCLCSHSMLSSKAHMCHPLASVFLVSNADSTTGTAVRGPHNENQISWNTTNKHYRIILMCQMSPVPTQRCHQIVCRMIVCQTHTEKERTCFNWTNPWRRVKWLDVAISHPEHFSSSYREHHLHTITQTQHILDGDSLHIVLLVIKLIYILLFGVTSRQIFQTTHFESYLAV